MPEIDVDDLDLDGDESAEGGSDNNGIKSLRSALKKAQQELKKHQDMVQQYQAQQRQQSLSALLESKGLSPKLAKYVAADAGDKEINDAFVDSWVKDNGELFGVQTEEAKPNVADEVRNAHEAISKATAAGSGSKPMDFEEAERQMAALSDRDPEFEKKFDAIFKAINPNA